MLHQIYILRIRSYGYILNPRTLLMLFLVNLFDKNHKAKEVHPLFGSKIELKENLHKNAERELVQ